MPKVSTSKKSVDTSPYNGSSETKGDGESPTLRDVSLVKKFNEKLNVPCYDVIVERYERDNNILLQFDFTQKGFIRNSTITRELRKTGNSKMMMGRVFFEHNLVPDIWDDERKGAIDEAGGELAYDMASVREYDGEFGVNTSVCVKSAWMYRMLLHRLASRNPEYFEKNEDGYCNGNVQYDLNEMGIIRMGVKLKGVTLEQFKASVGVRKVQLAVYPWTNEGKKGVTITGKFI